MTITHPRIPALLLVTLALAGGCNSVSIPTWQKSVQTYVREQCNGDAGCLRDLMLDNSRRGFAVIGSNLPDGSTDVVGLLLAHRQIAGEKRFVYLVGVVKDRQVRDIRVAALSAGSNEFRWRIGGRSDASLDRYRDFSESRWRSLHPGRKQPPDDVRDFPALRDSFALHVTGDNVIIVVHDQSDARWTLDI